MCNDLMDKTILKILQFYAQNELISNLTPATGLKIVGTGACLPWCSISSSFQNSLKTYGHQGYEFLYMFSIGERSGPVFMKNLSAKSCS